MRERLDTEKRGDDGAVPLGAFGRIEFRKDDETKLRETKPRLGENDYTNPPILSTIRTPLVSIHSTHNVPALTHSPPFTPTQISPLLIPSLVITAQIWTTTNDAATTLSHNGPAGELQDTNRSGGPSKLAAAWRRVRGE